MSNKTLKWNFIFQYGWVLTNIFNSLLLLPLYLKNIDASTLGVWLATGNILGWMMLVDPGIGEVLQQKIAEIRGQGDNHQTGKLVASGFMAAALIFIASIILGLACFFFIGRIIEKDIFHYPHLGVALLVSILAMSMTLVSFTVSGINQGMHNSAHVAISSLTANFLFLITNLVLLYMGFGVLSIALANLVRAVYINFFNIISLLKLLKRESCILDFEWKHFRQFARIFSVTSMSKIITGLSYSIDMIVLARYLSPASITMYEINKRPINVSYSLIGRHSVALMPVISHDKGRGNKEQIVSMLTLQFRIYYYAAFMACILFLFNYENLIQAWTGKGHFAGNLIINLLIGGFFINLIDYFLAIVGYALGDIKMNSLYNIIRNIIFGVCMFFSAKYYGIAGTLVVSIVMALGADFIFYSWRLKKLGYAGFFNLKAELPRLMLLVPGCLLCGWGIHLLLGLVIPTDMLFARLLAEGGLFVISYLTFVLLSDNIIKQHFRDLARNVFARLTIKKVASPTVNQNY